MRPRRLGASLLAGIALTCMIGWACERWSAKSLVSRSVTQDAPRTELPIAFPAAGLARRSPDSTGQGFVFERYAGPGIEIGRCYTYEQAHLDMNTYLVAYTRCGWPFRALQFERERDLWTQSPPVFSGAIVFSDRPTGVVLALRPLFPGFVLDVAIYAAGVFSLVLTAVAVRGALSKRAEQCSSCGYDRGGLEASANCPECGTAPGARAG